MLNGAPDLFPGGEDLKPAETKRNAVKGAAFIDDSDSRYPQPISWRRDCEVDGRTTGWS